MSRTTKELLEGGYFKRNTQQGSFQIVLSYEEIEEELGYESEEVPIKKEKEKEKEKKVKVKQSRTTLAIKKES
jgi:hypothetical protein